MILWVLNSTMAIAPLPQSTIHLLGSAQALTTPTSLVKELLDNAIDAKATSIDIIISPNTLDKVEVRDNGHGIQQEDLNSLGRRGHTSKLRSFDELKSIGGISLGFRGEALASAAQLGEVSVTTKTEGEAVASYVKLKALGGVEKQSHTSHPVGSTITITNFMARLPVRKQTALKEATKTLGKIKDLVQCYALARPHIRFSLKITKGGKGSWSFAPRPSDGIREAIGQVIGREAAAQCDEKTIVFSEEQYPDAEEGQRPLGTGHENGKRPNLKSNDFVVELFLPKPNAEPSKMGHGQYLSVDSRPVAHDKGTLRRIVVIFKGYISNSALKSPDKIKNPFLWMNIKCPTASYDANVEPAKDDILFGNEYLILESLEKFFKSYYGTMKASEPPPSKLLSDNEGFELLLARKPANLPAVNASPEKDTSSFQTLPIANKVLKDEIEDDNLKPAQKRRWNIDMSTNLSEEGEAHNPPGKRQWLPPTPEQTCPSEPESSLNPWLIAKMTAPLNPRSTAISTILTHDVFSHPENIICTPHQSSDPSNELDIGIGNTQANVAQPAEMNNLASLIPKRSINYHQGSPGLLQTLQLEREPLADLEDELLLDIEESQSHAERPRQQNDFISARNFTKTEPLVIPIAVANSGARQARTNTSKPFIPPIRTTDHQKQDGFRQTTLFQSSRPQDRSYTEPSEADPQLEWAMDYETRKADLNQRRRQEERVARAEAALAARAEAALYEKSSHDYSPSPTRKSPHKNRYNAAVTALSAPIANPTANPITTKEKEKSSLKTSLPDSDPRLYLMRRQISILANPSLAAVKLSRAKSVKLPFERIPDEDRMHPLVLAVKGIGIDGIRRESKELGAVDGYVRRGVYVYGMRVEKDGNGNEKKEVEERVKRVVESWRERHGVHDGEKDEIEMEYCFDGLGD